MRWLVLIALLSLSACGNPLPPTPTNVGGDYTIYGSNPDGSTYEGGLTIIDSSPLLLSWRTGGEPVESVGVGLDEVVAAAYGPPGCGVALFMLHENGTLEGIWATDGMAGTGTETWTPSGTNRNIGGIYELKGRNPDGSDYRGSITVSPGGDRFAVRWNFTQPVEGIGIQRDDMFAVGYGEGCGVVIYQRDTDGNLAGQWTLPGNERIAAEQAIRR